MNLLFFIETGCGNSASMASELIAIHNTAAICVYSVSSSFDIDNGVSASITNKGIFDLKLEGLEEHKNALNHIRSLRRFIIAKNIDIIHVQTNWELALVRLAIFAMKNRPRVIYTIHAFRNNGIVLKKLLAQSLIGLELFFFADKIIATSAFLHRKFKLLSYKMETLPLGVDEYYINRQHYFANRCLNILFPGVFREGKGQDVLIRAFNEYLKESGDSNSLLILPGDGEQLPVCQKLASALGIDSQVQFPGRCSKSELLNYYDKTNVLACSSKSETFSFILAEGYCLGKCIVTTPVGIAEEIVVNGVNGYIVKNIDELKLALLSLAKDPQIMLTMGDKNYKDRFRFSWKNIANRYLTICYSLK